LIRAPAPIQVLAVSEWATPQEWLEQWSRITGVKSRIERADFDQFRADDPTGFMGMMLETSGFMEEFGFTGKDKNILMPEEVSDMEPFQLSMNHTDSRFPARATTWRFDQPYKAGGLSLTRRLVSNHRISCALLPHILVWR
jgi:hypothetical protein